ncbi:MAG: hypothetical protein ABGX16_11410, partial [Pirellulales bacterium]
RCFRHFVAIAVSKPQPESRALADCRRTHRLQAVVFSYRSTLKRAKVLPGVRCDSTNRPSKPRCNSVAFARGQNKPR